MSIRHPIPKDESNHAHDQTTRVIALLSAIEYALRLPVLVTLATICWLIMEVHRG